MLPKEADHRRRPVVADGIAEIPQMKEGVRAPRLQEADRLRRGVQVSVAVGDEADASAVGFSHPVNLSDFTHLTVPSKYGFSLLQVPGYRLRLSFSGGLANGLMSSKNSPEKTISDWFRFSKSMAAASDVASMFRSSARLVSRIPPGLFAVICRAQARAVSRSASGVDDPVYQADPLRLFGGDLPARVEDLGCPGEADEAGEEIGGPQFAAGEADVDERGDEGGRGRREPDVGGKRQAETGARGGAVHGGNHRLGNRPEAEDETGVALLGEAEEMFRIGKGLRILAPHRLAQIGPGAEAAARAGEDEDPDRLILGKGAKSASKSMTMSGLIALRRSGRFRVTSPMPGSGSVTVIAVNGISATRMTHLPVCSFTLPACFSPASGERGLPDETRYYACSFRFFFSISLTSRRSTLPSALFGRASMNSISCGTFSGASLSRQWVMISSASATSPGLRTT